MTESHREERRLEVLRALCVGQPRETVNLYFAPLKNMTPSQTIERSLDRLRQRYRVSGRFVSEPNVLDIRNGHRVAHAVSSLKAFNEDSNTLEVFAYANDQVENFLVSYC